MTSSVLNLGMNLGVSERLKAIQETNEQLKAAKLNNPSGPPAPPPPPMDWPHPQGNPRMVRLRKFEPGRVPGTLKKSEMEQVSLAEGSIMRHHSSTADKSTGASILCNSSFTWFITNQHITSYLQGSHQPKCGLAASCMAAEVLKHPNFEEFETDDFFEVALEEGYTKQGEMFWAEDMSNLVQKVLDCESKVIYGNINDNWEIIIDHLIQGYPWLVPHDADPNHTPTMKNGEKSHWGVVTGFCVGLNQSSNIKGVRRAGSIKVRNLYIVENFKNCTKEFKNKILQIDPRKDPVFLFAKQGRTPGLKIWEWSALADSNEQLNEFDSTKFPGDYNVPDGGPAEGLKLKSVLLKPNLSWY